MDVNGENQREEEEVPSRRSQCWFDSSTCWPTGGQSPSTSQEVSLLRIVIPKQGFRDLDSSSSAIGSYEISHSFPSCGDFSGCWSLSVVSLCSSGLFQGNRRRDTNPLPRFCFLFFFPPPFCSQTLQSSFTGTDLTQMKQ